MSIPLSVLLRSAMKVDANINRELEQKELTQAIAKLSATQPEVTITQPELNLDMLKIDHGPVIDLNASTEPLAALFPDAGDEDEPDTALEVLQNGTDQNGNGQGLESGHQEPGNSEGQENQPVEILDQGQGEEVTGQVSTPSAPPSAAAPVVTSPWEETPATETKAPAKSTKTK